MICYFEYRGTREREEETYREVLRGKRGHCRCCEEGGIEKRNVLYVESTRERKKCWKRKKRTGEGSKVEGEKKETGAKGWRGWEQKGIEEMCRKGPFLSVYLTSHLKSD